MSELQRAVGLLGRRVTVVIDRPAGSLHPIYGFRYPINYGELPEYRMPDGGGLDAYVVDVVEPVREVTGKVVGVIERVDDPDDPKLLVAVTPRRWRRAELLERVAFVETGFPHRLRR